MLAVLMKNDSPPPPMAAPSIINIAAVLALSSSFPPPNSELCPSSPVNASNKAMVISKVTSPCKASLLADAVDSIDVCDELELVMLDDRLVIDWLELICMPPPCP